MLDMQNDFSFLLLDSVIRYAKEFFGNIAVKEAYLSQRHSSSSSFSRSCGHAQSFFDLIYFLVLQGTDQRSIIL